MNTTLECYQRHIHHNYTDRETQLLVVSVATLAAMSALFRLHTGRNVPVTLSLMEGVCVAGVLKLTIAMTELSREDLLSLLSHPESFDRTRLIKAIASLASGHMHRIAFVNNFVLLFLVSLHNAIDAPSVARALFILLVGAAAIRVLRYDALTPVLKQSLKQRLGGCK